MLELKGIKIDNNIIAVKSGQIKPLEKDDEFNVVVGNESYKCVVSSKEKKFFGSRDQHYYYSFRFNCLSHNVQVTEYTGI